MIKMLPHTLRVLVQNFQNMRFGDKWAEINKWGNWGRQSWELPKVGHVGTSKYKTKEREKLEVA